jgi:hypothetical protein
MAKRKIRSTTIDEDALFDKLLLKDKQFRIRRPVDRLLKCLFS